MNIRCTQKELNVIREEGECLSIEEMYRIQQPRIIDTNYEAMWNLYWATALYLWLSSCD